MLSFEAYWTPATGISLIRNGTTQGDEFVSAAPAKAYGLECVPESGHCYDLYPVGASVLAAPIVAAMQVAVRVAGPPVPRSSLGPRSARSSRAT